MWQAEKRSRSIFIWLTKNFSFRAKRGSWGILLRLPLFSRQISNNVLLLNYLKKGYANYRFLTKGDNCDACNALKNRVFPISQAKAGENLAPLHLNCDCKTAILDKNGKIAFLAEDQLDKLLSAFDFSRPWEKKNRIGKNDTGRILPPLFTSDGVKITSKNKENKDTWDYFIKYVYNKVDGYSDSLGTPVYTLYLAWLEETYGENKRESLWGWSLSKTIEWQEQKNNPQHRNNDTIVLGEEL